MAQLTVTLGIPAAGKSTWANAQHQHVITVDALRSNPNARTIEIFRSASHAAATHLAAGHDTILDACSTQPRRRWQWLTLARKHHATTRLAIIHITLNEARARNATRPHPVPDHVLTTYHHAMQDALTSITREPWDVIQHVGIATGPVTPSRDRTPPPPLDDSRHW